MAKLPPNASKEEFARMNEETHEVIARLASRPASSYEDMVNRRLAEMPAEEPAAIDDEVAELRDLHETDRDSRRLAKRPGIDHLDLAVAVTELDGAETLVPLFNVGDRIVADRCSTFLQGDWLDTRVLTVQHIDDDTGVVRCRDDESDQLTYVSFKDPLHDLRLCPPRGDPFKAPRMRIAASGGPQNTGGKSSDPNASPKRGRGRPKGSKNRPKEVVEAERQERAASTKRRSGRRRGKR